MECFCLDIVISLILIHIRRRKSSRWQNVKECAKKCFFIIICYQFGFSFSIHQNFISSLADSFPKLYTILVWNIQSSLFFFLAIRDEASNNIYRLWSFHQHVNSSPYYIRISIIVITIIVLCYTYLNFNFKLMFSTKVRRIHSYKHWGHEQISRQTWMMHQSHLKFRSWAFELIHSELASWILSSLCPINIDEHA